MLKITTGGESHGRALTAIIEGMPAGVTIDRELIARNLKLRKIGYGRGGRQKIEDDFYQILSGVRNNVTLGSPITVTMPNKDFDNWSDIMNDDSCDISKRVVHEARPGHADYVGAKKYGFDDIRNVLERASARETAIRVCATSIVMSMLAPLGIRSCSYTKTMNNICDSTLYSFNDVYKNADKSLVGANSEKYDKLFIEQIDTAKSQGNTLGASVVVMLDGVKAGIGSYVTPDRKLDANLAFALMGVQAVKAVEIGDGVDFAKDFGSNLLDEITCDKNKFKRISNHSGGIDGGMSNGETIKVTTTMKPIPTLMKPLNTVNIKTNKPTLASTERSDTAVPLSLCIISECVACFEVLKMILAECGNSNFKDTIKRWGELSCNL